MSTQDFTGLNICCKFTELFSDLEDFNENEQKQKIEEMNGLLEEMDKEEFKLVFTKELFDKINKMIGKKKMSLNNAFLLLKHAGFCRALFKIQNYDFNDSSLSERFEKMIIDENKKKKEKNEVRYLDLCECYFLLNKLFSSELLSICIPGLLKVALNKEKSEETQKEVELALLAMGVIEIDQKIEKDLYLNEMKEIIIYHQEHHNLTRLAYQSAWQFLMNRFDNDNSLEAVIVNELHFVREAIKELEELMKCVDWKKKKEEEKGKETKALTIIWRWIDTLGIFFDLCSSRNEEYSVLVESIVQAFRAAKDKNREIGKECFYIFESLAENEAIKIEDLIESGAVSLVLEEILRPTMDDEMTCDCLVLFVTLSSRLKEEKDDEKEEEKRKITKRKMFEKLEEEGYEDIIVSFHEPFDFLEQKFYYELSLDISDYFVNI
ncbi:uncharacterized protein MONOS_13055 [Monocercomonoides exilis]|uniref:uncharacterized protein n=1 Tax=Monocercomonoides exilis TaxID=2049356 RepID=UPI00355AA406|nr:hypothetical protein MONOS_13055 [Monocercomonoides exilis]